MHVEKNAQSNRLSGEQIKTITPVENTPFVYIHNNDTGKGFLSLGRFIIINDCPNLEFALEKLPKIDNWETLLTVIAVVMDLVEDNQKK